jgi:hypothetical protein
MVTPFTDTTVRAPCARTLLIEQDMTYSAGWMVRFAEAATRGRPLERTTW